MQGTVKPALLLALVAAPLLVHGSWSSVSVGTDAVYKCEQGGQVTFQDTSCPPGATQTPARLGDNAKQKAQEQADSQPSEMEAAASQENVLARFRLSHKTPLLPKNDGKLETAFYAPKMQPGELLFIVGTEGSGSDAWYRAFRIENGKRDYGVVASGALLGQDESIPLNDWVYALEDPAKVGKASRKTSGFEKLPNYDPEQYCSIRKAFIEDEGQDYTQKVFRSCLDTQKKAKAKLKGKFASLPFLIRKTCAIETVDEKSSSYRDLRTCIAAKQKHSGDALTFPQ